MKDPAMKDPAMKDLGPAEQASDRAELVNAVGLHARPSVKLTQLAKTFTCRVEIALSADGPWVDAKSPVKVMRVKAPRGAVLHVRSSGKGAQAAVEALMDLVRAGFGEANEPAGLQRG
jgi:phosphocarrier protein HPr